MTTDSRIMNDAKSAYETHTFTSPVTHVWKFDHMIWIDPAYEKWQLASAYAAQVRARKPEMQVRRIA